MFGVRENNSNRGLSSSPSISPCVVAAFSLCVQAIHAGSPMILTYQNQRCLDLLPLLPLVTLWTSNEYIQSFTCSGIQKSSRLHAYLLCATYTWGSFVSSFFCWMARTPSCSFVSDMEGSLTLGGLSVSHVIQDAVSLDVCGGVCWSGGGGVACANQSTLGGWGWATEEPLYSKCLRSSKMENWQII